MAPKTTYLVLSRDRLPGGAQADTFSILGTTEATSADAAITNVANGDPGFYVAVPARNWNEGEVESYTPPTRTRVRLLDREHPSAHIDPNQTSIEEELEARDLASEIEGEAA